MNPKEKAQELVNKMSEQTHLKFYNNSNVAKLCALIAVNEIIKLNINDRVFISEDKDNNTIVYSTYTEYWSEVLIEITKL